MKTNLIARAIVRIRPIVVCLVLVAVTGMAYGFGASLGSRFGPTTASQAGVLQPPPFSLQDVIAAAR